MKAREFLKNYNITKSHDDYPLFITEIRTNQLCLLMEAYANHVRDNNRYFKCDNCGGMGVIKDGKYSEDCMKCGGIGQIYVEL